MYFLHLLSMQRNTKELLYYMVTRSKVEWKKSEILLHFATCRFDHEDDTESIKATLQKRTE